MQPINEEELFPDVEPVPQQNLLERVRNLNPEQRQIYDELKEHILSGGQKQMLKVICGAAGTQI